MSIKRRIRSNKFLNRLVRVFLLKTLLSTNKLIKKISAHWRVSGHIKFQLDGIGSFSMYSKCDDVLVDSLYYKSFDESAELQLFSSLCHEAHIILDIGANTGLYSLVASSVNPHALIYAFEPYLSNFSRLKYNININDFSNIFSFSQAIGSYDGTTSFYVPKGKNKISQVSSVNKEFSESHLQNDVVEYEKTEVEIIKLDSFIKMNKLSRVDIIKIDVESLEIDVLNGSRNCLEKYSPLIFCEIFYSSKNNKMIDRFLIETDYLIYTILDEGILKVPSILQSNKRNYLLAPNDLSNHYYLEKYIIW